PAVLDVLASKAPRLILFAGSPAPGVAAAERPAAPVTVEPPLPAGLSLDPDSGVVRGAARAASPGRVHVLRDARGATSSLWVEVLAAPGPRTSRFVSLSGDDRNPGTMDRPYRTVARGSRDLVAGMTLFLRKGVYRESVELRGMSGTEKAPVQIRSYPGEHAVIDASEPMFADSPGRAWRRAKGRGAHPDEWVSTQTFPAEGKDTSSRGAFLDRPSYTRLLTYSRIEDLRADNQSWDPLDGGDERPGPEVKVRERSRKNASLAGKRLPWTYFGPGIHFDKETGRIHIRLSHTKHGVAGLEEYRGPTDPRRLHLAISSRADRALGIFGSQHVRVADLSLRHGGDETARIQGGSDVVLEHVDIAAASFGLVIGETERARVLHSRVDGGIPPWSFRSDFKASYKLDEPGGEEATNNLVRKTQRVLLFMARRNVDVEIAYSEFEDGHDLYVSGTRTDFHHNRIHNVHDEAIFLQAATSESGLRIHHNVIDQVLSGLSFSGKGTGARYVYRNVFDLRTPTASYRPSAGSERDVWRYGHPFKNTGNLGRLFFYQNTVLVSRPHKTPFLQFSVFGKDDSQVQQRWFLNNVFLVLQPGAEFDKAVSFVPPPHYLALRGQSGAPLIRSDGNLWVRVGSRQRPLFRCAQRNQGPSCGQEKFWRLADASGRTGAGPGFEVHSRESETPGFRRAKTLDRATPGDDLRPGPASPALSRGIALPPDLPDPQRGRSDRPDAGALAAGQPPLRVGVDARLVY
ncbi:MAG TPA: hypothetical protein VNO33_21485, partial [Kofleriaceae bacterium]|nr:hypothetical protein [Kofleriaceae bacterium]